jgi:hypothetical protein
MAKHLASTYRPGRRSAAWRKIKPRLQGTCHLTSETTGQSTNSSYAHQVTTSYAYDALNRRTQTLDAYGTSAQTTATVIYDAVGNVVSETTGYSSTSSYSNPLTTSYGYDALYRQTAVLDAYGTSIQRTSTTVYDSADNVIQSIDAANFTTTYARTGRASTDSTLRRA